MAWIGPVLLFLRGCIGGILCVAGVALLALGCMIFPSDNSPREEQDLSS